ncbi:MAG: 3-phosphoshikimate 1-carboxyvinyltransferase [Ferruginibacter sp.]
MIAIVSPSKVSGIIKTPPSKSAMQRACALALLNNGKTIIQNPGNSDDDLAAINVIRELGATVDKLDNNLVVKSNGSIASTAKLHCGESGLSLRMFASIAALGDSNIILDGKGSLLKRPIHFFEKIFPLLNVQVKTNKGFLPAVIKGPLMPTNITIDGSKSSQYLTGLLFAFSKSATDPVIITVNGLTSKPYIDLSLQMLDHFGYKVTHEDHTKFFISPIKQPEKDIVYHTEGDWSAASFILVAGALAGNIKVKGLDIYSAQADLAIMDVLQQAGANIHVEGNCVLIDNTKKLMAFNFDATDSPDLFPPLVALAAYCNGESIIRGISRLIEKESNRINSLVDVFTVLGVSITVKDDSMLIIGSGNIKGGNVSSHQDHRIAMASAVAALASGTAVTINDAEAVNKSYPDFYEHLKLLGATVSLHA